MAKSIEPVYRLFGNELKRMRGIREYSQDDAASAVGLSKVSICNIEEGRQRILLHDIVSLIKAKIISKDAFFLVVTEALKND